jgi:hypothetical protein
VSRIKNVSVGVLGVLTTSCALGIAAGADYSPTVDFGVYSSFTWDEPDDRPVGDPRLENNPFFDDRLHAAVAVELAKADIREGGSGPALIVHHHATVRDRVDVYEVDDRAGYGSPDYGDRTRVVQYDEGTILVDIADATTNDVIWRGWARFDIGRALAEPETMAKAIDEAVEKMFRRFPGLGS